MDRGARAGAGREGRQMWIDYHTHPLAHGGVCCTEALLEGFVGTALANGLSELGLTDHDEYLEAVDMTCVEEIRNRYPGIGVRFGVEVDHLVGPDEARKRRQRLSGYRFDYLIGSVHQIEDWIFDHPDHIDRYGEWDVDELYREYFRRVADAALSGEYQIIGHLDIIKVFGYRPKRKIADLAEPALQAIKRSGVAVEINTNGLYKPAEEIYPCPDLLERCFLYNIPVTLGSDAHRAADVGRDLDRAAGLARRTGYRKMVTFCGGNMSVVELG